MQMKLLSLVLVAYLAGCSALVEKAERRVDDSAVSAATLMKSVGRTAPGVVLAPAPTVVRDGGIWLGKKIVKVGPPPLPPIFAEPATFDRSVSSLAELAERIALRSGIPTKVSPDALAVVAPPGAGGAGQALPLPMPMPMPPLAPGAVPTLPGARPGYAAAPNKGAQIHISYSNGDFKSFLDMAAARFGVYWKYSAGAIQFYHTDSRAFQISAIPGDSTFSAMVSSGSVSTGGVAEGGGGGASGGGASGVNANNVQNTAVTSQLSVYSNIEKSIKVMLSPYGKVVASPATGSITVVDTPDVLDRVAAFVENENQAMSRQVAINVTVLAVTLHDSDEYGINWNLVYAGLLNQYGIQNSFSAGSPNSVGFSAGVLSTSGSKLAGSSLLIKALAEQGKVQRKTSATVVTLNNQPVPVQVARQTSYLKSSQTTTTALVGATTTLTPGTVTSGFNMSILPHILNNGTLMLQFSTDISALRGLKTVTSNGSSIEAPELDTRNFLQRVAMKSNETLVISGFEQSDDSVDLRGVGNARNYLLGGGTKGGTSKEVIVILITPTAMAGS